jgi:hypothetical protein
MVKIQARKVMENPKDENPIIQSWHQFGTNNLLLVHHFEFMNLSQLTIFQIIGIVEDEKTFVTFTFMMSKLQNCLVEHPNKLFACLFKIFSLRTFSLSKLLLQIGMIMTRLELK